jgi:D-alanyl-D-alanine carboxypeptidase (penicillin-binding protein 5/6)
MQNMHIRNNISVFLVLVYACLCLCSFNAESFAASRKKLRLHQHRPEQASLVVHAASGKVLHQVNADKSLHPASLTKLMTIYITFEAINRGKLSFDTRLPISKYAASRPRTNLGLKAGKTITVKECILSLIVRSANDAAVVLAEAIGKTESNFAKIMTTRAHQLGMHGTHFMNASGWHHPSQKTTAYDMAKLAIALNRDFPEYYGLFSKTSFTYKNTKYKGHNYVTEHLPGAEGMKTGYTSKAGWNLVTAAKRGSQRLIGVVLGGSNAKSRDTKMINLINHHFAKLQTSEEQIKITQATKAQKNTMALAKKNLKLAKKTGKKLSNHQVSQTKYASKRPNKRNLDAAA